MFLQTRYSSIYKIEVSKNKDYLKYCTLWSNVCKKVGARGLHEKDQNEKKTPNRRLTLSTRTGVSQAYETNTNNRCDPS